MSSIKYLLIVIILVFPSWYIVGEEVLKPVNVRVGLLEVNSENTVEFRALRRIFDGLGIPYDVIIDTTLLEDYRVVYSGGALLNKSLSVKDKNALYDYVESGNVLVAAGEVGNGMYPLFGIRAHFPSRKRYRLTFGGDDVALQYIDHPNERTISLGNGEDHFYDEVIWSHGYRLSDSAVPLGIFSDGTAGFSLNYYGRGKAYLLGLSYTESVLLPQIGQDFEAQRRYVNAFEPSADVVMLILKAIYESSVSPFVYISTIPYAQSTALILSHDVDAQTSFLDSIKFADLEERYGVKSTFFENTKYFVDWMDIDYYNVEENVEAIRELKRRGWDIGSHTVSHYRQFSSVLEGDPGTTFESYEPLKQITVQGEVRVSKELLDRDIPGQNTIAFRAGDLEFPDILIRVLEEAGYLYDSTFSANDVLTALPFWPLRERNPGSQESSVLEIPVTLDDSMGYLTPETVDVAVEHWLEVARANMNNEAISVFLIHPSDTRTESYKLEAQEALMRGIVEMGGWIGDLTTFGNFWRDRDALRFRTHINKSGALVIEVEEYGSRLNPSIGFVVGNTEIGTIVVKDSTGSVLSYSVREDNNKIYVGSQGYSGY